MDPEPLRPEDARAALDGVDAVRRELAQKATSYPVWRHVAFAAIMAMLVLSQGFGLPLQILLPAAALAATVWLAADMALHQWLSQGPHAARVHCAPSRDAGRRRVRSRRAHSSRAALGEARDRGRRLRCRAGDQLCLNRAYRRELMDKTL